MVHLYESAPALRLARRSNYASDRIRNISGRLVGIGEVVDADAGANGKPAWLMKDMGVVSVGPGAQFLHVPPLSPDDRPLAIDKEYSGTPS